MAGVIPDEGELQALKIVLGTDAAEALDLRLYVNDKVPALADTVADYDEMSTHGYAAAQLVSADWSYSAADPGKNTPARAQAPVQAFTFALGGPSEDVFGYFLVGADSGRLRGAERFPDGPYQILNPGDQITIEPILRLRSGYPL